MPTDNRDNAIAQVILDSSTETRMAGLERFLERYLGPRQPEFGSREDEVRLIEMPAPLQRFFRFAGRWPGQNPELPYANRFCSQDRLCAIRKNKWAPTLQLVDNRLVFVCEAQHCWVAATERSGADPLVWISEYFSHEEALQEWRQLEKPLSHFLVSFVLMDLVFGSAEILAVAHGVLEVFEEAGCPIKPVWIRGEYAMKYDRPSYFLVDDRFLVRRALNEADGHDWYGCNDASGAVVLTSLGLPTEI